MQVELHRHLDVSLRTETLLELAQARGLETQGTSLSNFRQKLILRKPLADLSSVLAQFTLFQKVLDRPEVLRRVAFEALEDCVREGTTHVEFRFSPGWVAEHSQLSFADILFGFEEGLKDGLKKYPVIRAGLICIASRDYGVDEADRTIEFFLKNKTRFIGLDLAGNETAYPCRIFENSFKKAIAENSKITIHAGEASGPENIWEAIELLGARRIGHGISSVRDPRLLEYLREKNICLEMCPTSNWLTQCVTSFEQHPLKKVLDQGVPVSINTDDPGIFGVTLPHEIETARTKMGLSEADVEKCTDFALQATFL